MQKGNKGKLRTGTANKATYDWPWRAAKKPECWASPVSVYILFRTFGLHVWSLFSCSPLFAFEIYTKDFEVELREPLIEMEILIKHSFLHLFILHRSKCGNCDITYVLSISVTSINNNNNL